jgi:ATP-dependent Clp endopeptidase proteolytic subunit ClpP
LSKPLEDEVLEDSGIESVSQESDQGRAPNSLKALASLLAAATTPGLAFAHPAFGEEAHRRPRRRRATTPFAQSRTYSVPKLDPEEWVKYNEPLYKERVLHVGEEIDDEMMNYVIASMLFHDQENENDPIYMYINSPGGSVISGLALYDTMQHIKAPVITANIGIAASTASLLLGAGVRGKRLALPKSRVMIHQPSGGDPANAKEHDARVEYDQIRHIKDTVISMYAHMTGHSREKIEKDISYDNYMSADKAKEYGLVDKIVPIEGVNL